MEDIEAPPEAVLIERLRKSLPKSESAVSKVAKLAGISEGRWRQLAKGYQQTADTRVRATAPADTLARMARAVGATPSQLRRAGRKDAATELDRLLNAPESDTLRLLRVRATPVEERSPDDVQFIEEWEAAHPRRPDPNLGVDEDGNWLPVETTFENWQRARNQLNTRVLHYARARGISFKEAEEELPHVQQMATDVANGTGRPWTPPWDPGAEFEEGEEPWKSEFWTYTEAVPSPFGTEGHIYRLGTTYDLAEARRRQEITAQADEVWKADAHRQTAEYYEREGKSANDDADLTPNKVPASASVHTFKPRVDFAWHTPEMEKASAKLREMFVALAPIDKSLDLSAELDVLHRDLAPIMNTPTGELALLQGEAALLKRVRTKLAKFQADAQVDAQTDAMLSELEEYVNRTVTLMSTRAAGEPQHAAAARTAPPGYRSPGQAARDAQDQASESGQTDRES